MPLLSRIAFIGFGEAGLAFAPRMSAADRVRAFDVKTDREATRSAKRADYERAGVTGCDTLADALAEPELVISVVTADQALAAARSAAANDLAGALYCDCNSVAPETKREAAALIEAAGGRYVDVAVMAPVQPKCIAVPLLLAGPHAAAARETLAAAGFADIATAGDDIGRASAIKMVRSVMVKGLEALSAECLIASHRAGIADEVVASLEASYPGFGFAARGDYALDRMMVHGLRRAAEMDEVAETLTSLGVPPRMAEATAAWQRQVGTLGLDPGDDLAAKIAQIEDSGEIDE